MAKHIVQSPEWGEFKTKYGTKAIRIGKVQFTLHKLPFSSFNYAYAPKADPRDIEWEKLEKALKSYNCFVMNFDVPNIVADSKSEKHAKQILEEKCIKSNKNTFTKYNILLSLEKTEEELLAQMHKKHRYNVKYAERKGVTCRTGKTEEDFETFFKLFEETAVRQKYHIHPKRYYKKIWQLLHPQDICHILITEFEGKPLAAWMLFTYEGVLYYPYGGSSLEHRNLHGSCLIGWEAIKFGKKKGCRQFDMWGAAKDPDDSSDPEFGFTNFKLKFGGQHVEYIDSYDFVINPFVYNCFNCVNNIRWKILRLLR